MKNTKLIILRSKKIIKLSVLSLGIIFLAGCGQQQANQNQQSMSISNEKRQPEPVAEATTHETQDIIGVRGSSKILTVTNFEKIRSYLYKKDEDPKRKIVKIANFNVENFGTINPFDRFSIEGQSNGNSYKFMFAIEDKDTLNIFIIRKNITNGIDDMVSEELMTKEEVQSAESMLSTIIEEIKK